jgi:hypothetical protein
LPFVVRVMSLANELEVHHRLGVGRPAFSGQLNWCYFML